MSPYRVARDSTLEIEITKTFLVEVIGECEFNDLQPTWPLEIISLTRVNITDNSQSPPPELQNDTQSRFDVQMNSPVTLSCKCRSTTKPITIKWFKQKTNDSETDGGYHSTYMEIKYFENFYQPMPTVAIKELEENLYLSKLTINNVTEESSIYVCVAINYYGVSHRNFTILARRRKSMQQYDIIQESSDDDDDDDDVNLSSHDDKSFELFFIPLIFLLIVIIQISAIIYLLIYRQLMKDTNKTNIIY